MFLDNLYKINTSGVIFMKFLKVVTISLKSIRIKFRMYRTTSGNSMIYRCSYNFDMKNLWNGQPALQKPQFKKLLEKI